jgi:hypothetical protein
VDLSRPLPQWDAGDLLLAGSASIVWDAGQTREKSGEGFVAGAFWHDNQQMDPTMAQGRLRAEINLHAWQDDEIKTVAEETTQPARKPAPHVVSERDKIEMGFEFFGEGQVPGVVVYEPVSTIPFAVRAVLGPVVAAGGMQMQSDAAKPSCPPAEGGESIRKHSELWCCGHDPLAEAWGRFLSTPL